MFHAPSAIPVSSVSELITKLLIIATGLPEPLAGQRRIARFPVHSVKQSS